MQKKRLEEIFKLIIRVIKDITLLKVHFEIGTEVMNCIMQLLYTGAIKANQALLKVLRTQLLTKCPVPLFLNQLLPFFVVKDKLQ